MKRARRILVALACIGATASLAPACGPAIVTDPRIADPAKALREALSHSGDPPSDLEITPTYLRMTYSTGIVVLQFADVFEVKYGRDLRGLLVEVTNKAGATVYFFVATSEKNARSFMDALDAIRGKH